MQNAYSWSGKTPPAGIAAIDTGRLGMVIGTAGTASAFLVTLYVAERNYRRGREHIPHLTMRLHVARIEVSGQYDAIIVTLEATNTGSGLCTVNEIHWAVHALSNYDDETEDGMRQEFTERQDRNQETEFPWHQLETDVTSHAISIEPGETEQMTHDCLIPQEIDAVVTSAWVSNASDPQTTAGWYRRTPHIKGES